MDARDSDSVNDDEFVEIIMGTERDLGSESIDNTNSSSTKKKARAINLGKRKLRSPVWNTFTKLDTIFEDSKRRAQCKDCKKVMIDDSHHGTGNMKRHLNTYPAQNNVELFMSAFELCSQKFDPLVFCGLLVEAIIKHNLPFNFVEHEGIKALFAYASSNIKLPCRNTIKACVLRMFKIEKQALHNLLGSVEVQDGLKEIDSSVVKIRECIKYVKGFEARKLKFQECVKQVGILDSKRGLSDSNFESCPSSKEWDKVVKISKFLGYFYDVTCLFSGTKYPTSNLFFPKVFVIQFQIKATIDDCDSFMNKMGDYMHMKFQKYWSYHSLIMSIAIILDPRYKLHFVDWAYTKLHGVNSIEYKNVHGTLIALFNVYSEISAHLNYSNIPMNSMPNHQTEGGDALFEDFDNNYNGPNSVEKESAFSIWGKVLDQYRTLLLPDTVQALLCTRDWLFGKGVYAEESANVESLNENIFNITLEDNISSQNSNTFSHGD
ncbi:hypothetical protein FF2_022334 [Malus domestica]